MKRMTAMTMMLVLVVFALSGAAMAEGRRDYSVEGVYKLRVTMPADHDHVYVYDRPSSSTGKNLGRIDNGDLVYVYYITDGMKGRSSVWAYCDYEGREGYIRFCNLKWVGYAGCY